MVRVHHRKAAAPIVSKEHQYLGSYSVENLSVASTIDKPTRWEICGEQDVYRVI